MPVLLEDVVSVFGAQTDQPVIGSVLKGAMQEFVDAVFINVPGSFLDPSHRGALFQREIAVRIVLKTMASPYQIRSCNTSMPPYVICG